MRRLAAIVLLGLIFAGPASSAPVQFDFHSSFLLNLHSFLYNAAQRPDGLLQTAWHAKPTALEMQQLEAAVDYSRANFAKRHPVFDEELEYISDALATDDWRPNSDGLALPQALTNGLRNAAPAYARTA